MPLTQAATPWAMIARRAIGRVEKLSQPPKGDQAGFDVATVVLNAEAAKVYATTVGMLRKNQQVHVTTEESGRRTVDFSNGKRSAGITVTDLGPRLSRMVVASAVMPGQESATLGMRLSGQVACRNCARRTAFSTHVFKSLAGPEIHRQRLHRG
jgi:hypothetical protein